MDSTKIKQQRPANIPANKSTSLAYQDNIIQQVPSPSPRVFDDNFDDNYLGRFFDIAINNISIPDEDIQLIQTTEELKKLQEKLLACNSKAFAVDTETDLDGKLAKIQIGWAINDECLSLIDATRDMLYNKSYKKTFIDIINIIFKERVLFHGGQGRDISDISKISNSWPDKIWNTETAARVAGLNQLSYKDNVALFLPDAEDLAPGKEEFQKRDWGSPSELPAKAKRYALSDVKYLLHLYEKQKALLKKLPLKTPGILRYEIQKMLLLSKREINKSQELNEARKAQGLNETPITITTEKLYFSDPEEIAGIIEKFITAGKNLTELNEVECNEIIEKILVKNTTGRQLDADNLEQSEAFSSLRKEILDKFPSFEGDLQQMRMLLIDWKKKKNETLSPENQISFSNPSKLADQINDQLKKGWRDPENKTIRNAIRQHIYDQTFVSHTTERPLVLSQDKIHLNSLLENLQSKIDSAKKFEEVKHLQTNRVDMAYELMNKELENLKAPEDVKDVEDVEDVEDDTEGLSIKKEKSIRSECFDEYLLKNIKAWEKERNNELLHNDKPKIDFNYQELKKIIFFERNSHDSLKPSLPSKQQKETANEKKFSKISDQICDCINADIGESDSEQNQELRASLQEKLLSTKSEDGKIVKKGVILEAEELANHANVMLRKLKKMRASRMEKLNAIGAPILLSELGVQCNKKHGMNQLAPNKKLHAVVLNQLIDQQISSSLRLPQSISLLLRITKDADIDKSMAKRNLHKNNKKSSN